MDTAVEQETLETWRSFITAHSRVVERLSQELEQEAGLPLAWFDVLLRLSESDKSRLRMHQLADSLLLSRSAATRFIDRMESAGLVERIQCLTDGRGTFVQLSAAGLKRLRFAAPIHKRGVAEHFGQYLDESESRVIGAVMDRIGAAVSPVESGVS
jgi:DNA-binding MarR family transcriptional regulator